MKTIKETARAARFTAVSVGPFEALKDYVLELGPEVKIPGKVFGGQAVGATGSEFSFQLFAPGSETGFFHSHRRHEELYFFLRGEGEMEIDGEHVPVSEGSVVRIAPEARRTVRAASDKELLMLCVQYPAGTFTEADAHDGVIE